MYANAVEAWFKFPRKKIAFKKRIRKAIVNVLYMLDFLFLLIIIIIIIILVCGMS
jgi:hypothetical protein